MKKRLFLFLALAMIFSCACIMGGQKVYAEGDKTFILKKADGTELGQYDKIEDGWDEKTILGMMKKTDSNGSYTIEVTKDYEFEGSSRSLISGLNITFTSKEGTSPVLTSGNGMPHFFLKDGNYTFKNIILEGKSGSTGGGIYTHDDNQGITITLDSGTVIRNCNYIDAPYYYRLVVIRDKYNNDGKDSTLIINDGVTIEGCKTNSSNAGCAISVRDKCKLIVNGGTFKNNEAQTASYGGSAIFNDDEAETIINGGTFEGNKSAGNGGAIVNYGKLTINGGTFKNNVGLSGGAISSMSYDAELSITGGTFENNKSTNKWGGAIVAKNKVSVKNATFENNYSGNGGAIFAYNANGAVFKNCTFKNNGVDNEKSVKQGGALFVNGAKGVSIINNTFTKNTAQDGGALIVNNVEGSIERNTFEENFADRFSSAFHVKKSTVKITENTFTNNGKNDDKTTKAGTLLIESTKDNGEIDIEGNKFEKNAADLGSVIVVQEATVNINGCDFSNNVANEYGGTMYIAKNGNVNITNSKFIGNSAKRGGAIVTELFSQANPAEVEKYANLKIAEDVEFSGNFASDGYFNPPTNYDKFPELKFKTTSLMGQLRAIQDIQSDMKTYKKVDSLLNNYDVYYVNPLITVTYDANGGTPAEKIFGEELTSENDEITPAVHKVKTLKETGLKKEGAEFKGWNTKADGSGETYEAGKEKEFVSNQVLYAIWEDKKPEPGNNDKPNPGDEKPNPDNHRHRGGIMGGILLNNVESGRHVLYVKGYPDMTFKAEGNITRAEAVAMVVRLKGYPLIENSGAIFSDVAEKAWYEPEIVAAYRAGILEEKKGEAFRPDEKITRAELAQLISHIDKTNEAKAPFSDVAGHKFEAAINQNYGNHRIDGYPDGTFKPDRPITRAETTKMLNRLFNRSVDEAGVYDVKDEVRHYVDLSKNHWAYYEIMEASHTHNYERAYSAAVEHWTKLMK